MGFLFDILMEVITAFIPSRNHNDRSIVGESRLDQNAKMWVLIIVGALVLISAGVWIWWRYFR